MSPYFDSTFWGWFPLFFSRLQDVVTMLLQGTVPCIYSDEIQIFVLFCFSSAASFFGTFLLLKRLTMMANALSHTMLVGVVVTYLLSLYGEDFGLGSFLSHGILFGSAIILSIVTVGFLYLLSKSRYMTLDAANGMTFTFLFAFGVTLLSLFCKNAQVGTDMIMGNVDLLTGEDLSFVFFSSLCVLFVGLVFFRGFTVSTFDPVFAGCGGMRPFLLDLLLYVLVGVTITSAFKAVGFILSLSFFVIPPLTARLLTHKLTPMLLFAQGFATLACVVGVALSRHILSVLSLPVSTGALIATLLSVQYVLVLFFRRLYDRKKAFVT